MSVDLVNTNKFTTNVSCMLPGEGTDAFQTFKFDATFELIPEDEWTELLEDSTRGQALKRVLLSVGDNVQPATIQQDGQEINLSPVDVICRNIMTCDAAFMHYHLYVTRNSRDKAASAAEVKNSKRSRRR